MNQQYRMEDARAVLDAWVRPDDGEPDTDTMLVGSIPANTMLMRRLNQELRAASVDVSRSEAQRAQLRTLLTGNRSPADVLSSGAFPILDRDKLPADAQAIVAQLQDTSEESS